MWQFQTIYSAGHLFAVLVLLSFSLLAQGASAQLTCGATDKETLLGIKDTLDPKGILNWREDRSLGVTLKFPTLPCKMLSVQWNYITPPLTELAGHIAAEGVR